MTNHHNSDASSSGVLPQTTTKSKVECKKLRLAEAISDGRLYQTKVILEDKPNLNYLDGDGLSPLMRAFLIEDDRHRTRTALVKLLLQHKVDVNLKDKEQRHALILACQLNRLDLVKIMFSQCLQDVEMTAQDREGNTPLMYAVQNNNKAMVQLIVDAMRKFSLTVDQRNLEDKTAYYKAVELGYKECAQILADVGKASREIQVNPFLDYLTLEKNTEYQVHSAKLSQEPPTITKNGVGVVVAKRARRRYGVVSRFANGNATRSVFTASKNRNAALVNRTNQQAAKKAEKSKSTKNLENSNTIVKHMDTNQASGRAAGKSKSKSSKNGENCRNTIPRTRSENGFILPLRRKIESTSSKSKTKTEQSFTGSFMKEATSVKRTSLQEVDSQCVNNRSIFKSNEDTQYANNNCIESNEHKSTNYASHRHLKPPASRDRFLRLILDDVKTDDEGRRSRSPIYSISARTSRSVSPLYINENPSYFPPKPVSNNFLKCPQRQSYPASVSEHGSTKTELKHSAYSVWMANVVDDRPNTLRSLLALRAEQQDESSSFRKGLVLPKYCDPSPTSERAPGEVMSITSEKSTKSEATKKVIAAAKSIGISALLAKRKGLGKKD